MTSQPIVEAIWIAGAVHLAIIAANIPLPRMLRVGECLADVPRFVRQIFYVHWSYIIIVLAMFAALCFAKKRDLQALQWRLQNSHWMLAVAQPPNRNPSGHIFAPDWARPRGQPSRWWRAWELCQSDPLS